MLRNMMVIVAVVCVALCLVAGCEKKQTTPPPAPTVSEVTAAADEAAAKANEAAAKATEAAAAATEAAETAVKTAEEYKAEADKQITKDNANAELDKLEQEVKSDAATVE